MRVRGPTVVWPSMWTCDWSLQSSPITTLLPTAQYGRYSHWSSRSQHRADFRFGDDLTINLGFTAVPPHVPFVSDFRDVILEGIARRHGPAEFRFVDGHEVD